MKGYVKLKVLNNCFNDRNKTHLGVKYKDKWYAISHKARGGILIPPSCFKITRDSGRAKFLVKVDSAPNVVKPISAWIHKSLLDNYDTILNQ